MSLSLSLRQAKKETGKVRQKKIDVENIKP